MDRYFPRSSVGPVIAGMLLAWIVGPAFLAFVMIGVAQNPYLAQGALPFEFFGFGVVLIGVICLIVGAVRALKTVDFLGRREYARMEDEERYAQS